MYTEEQAKLADEMGQIMRDMGALEDSLKVSEAAVVTAKEAVKAKRARLQEIRKLLRLAKKG